MHHAFYYMAWHLVKKGLFSTLDVMSVEQKEKEKGETSVIVKIIGGGIHEHYCLA